MRSIGTRLAIWYAVASAVSLAGAAMTGFYLLERHLVRNIDEQNRAEFQQLRAVLRPDFTILDPEPMAERLRNATDSTQTIFFIEAWQRTMGTVFATDNLQNRSMASSRNELVFNATLDGVGDLRVGQFKLGRMTILVASSLASVQDVRTIYLEVSAGLVAVMAVVSSALGFGLSRVALQPMRAIQRTAEHISSDNLSERIPVAAVDDEISNLARLLNRTFDRLETSFNQVRRFTAEASHELKTPLTLARVHAEKLLAIPPGTPGHDESVQNILEELAQLEKIIEELLLLSRAEANAVPLEMRLLNPHTFLRAFVQDARVLGEFREVRIEERYDGTGTAEFDPKWIRQVLLNLLTNALRVSPRGGVITVTSRIDSQVWRLTLEDEGPGVPPDQMERIFERFFRLAHEQDGKEGSGLGLAISRSFVALHRGRIYAEQTERSHGLRVIVELPSATSGGPRVVVDGNSLARASEMAK
ncbi:MAG: cusS [Lacunisphaera sp.]|nr:cusS [Lacunisphaera sp.]